MSIVSSQPSSISRLQTMRKNKMRAEEGHAASQFLTGMNLIDKGTTKSSKEEGLRWMRLAADQNYPLALLKLGECHRLGIDGVTKKKIGSHSVEILAFFYHSDFS